jgi:hypothetical protein
MSLLRSSRKQWRDVWIFCAVIGLASLVSAATKPTTKYHVSIKATDARGNPIGYVHPLDYVYIRAKLEGEPAQESDWYCIGQQWQVQGHSARCVGSNECSTEGSPYCGETAVTRFFRYYFQFDAPGNYSINLKLWDRYGHVIAETGGFITVEDPDVQ